MFLQGAEQFGDPFLLPKVVLRGMGFVELIIFRLLEGRLSRVPASLHPF